MTNQHTESNNTSIIPNNNRINDKKKSNAKKGVINMVSNSKRLLILVGAFILTIVVTWAITAAAIKRPVMVQKDSYIHIVKDYDTLWGICDDYAPEGMDIRTFINIVKRFNNIEDGSYIYPGQKIEVPIFVDIYKK